MFSREQSLAGNEDIKYYSYSRIYGRFSVATDIMEFLRDMRMIF
jgi:hypothetical protein